MDFNEWLRESCFQQPPKHCEDLAKMAWNHQQARLDELEAQLDAPPTDSMLAVGTKVLEINITHAQATDTSLQLVEIVECIWNSMVTDLTLDRDAIWREINDT